MAKKPIQFTAGQTALPVRWTVAPLCRSLLVLAHGAGAGMDHPFMESTAQGLLNRGVGTMRFNFPFLAEGRRRPDSPSVAIAAWEAAVAFAEEYGEGRALFVGGKSFGGRMAVHWAANHPRKTRGLVLLGYPFQGAGTRPQPQRLTVLKEAPGPLLFLQGDRDKLGPLGLVRPTVRGLGRRAKLHVVTGGDHGFAVLKRSGRDDGDVQNEICHAVSQWIDNLL